MKKISRRAITLWRVKGLIQTGIYLIISLVLYGLYMLFDWMPLFVPLIAFGITFVAFLFEVIVIPSIRYKYIRYGIIDEELRVHQGIWIRQKVHVPLFRIQNIDTHAGILMRRFNVKGVMLRTAASVVYIPELDEDEADCLREEIRSIVNMNVGRSI